MMFFIDSRLFSPPPSDFLVAFMASRKKKKKTRPQRSLPKAPPETKHQTGRDHDDRLDGLGDHAAILQSSQCGGLLLCERPSRS